MGLVFQMLGGQKKLMGCGLLGGGNQGDTMNSFPLNGKFPFFTPKENCVFLMFPGVV